MRFDRLADTVAGLYAAQAPGSRLAQAKRLVRLALMYCDAEPSGEAADRDLIHALAYLLGVREELSRDMELRGRVESCFVEAGWPAVKTRLLLKSLEQLPDKPTRLEEKCVVDAETTTRLGVLGFARHLSKGSAAGEPYEATLRLMHRELNRRMYTKAGAEAVGRLKDDLRTLSAQLKRSLEGSGVPPP